MASEFYRIEIAAVTTDRLASRMILTMGLLTVDIEIVGADETTSERHPALVDTGASYLSLPRTLLERLGYEPLDTQRVVFANGETAVWDVTEVTVRLGGRERTVIAFMAEPGAPALVGAQTLETFGLGVDPVGLRLIPVDAYLATSARGS
jgi:clan AA aspartic protease